MLTTKNLEKLIELETSLRAEYQVQLDAKSAEIEAGAKKQEEQQTIIAKQLEQISTLSTEATANKRIEQLNRELESRSEKLQEEVTSQKGRIKSLQKDLAEERAEIKTLKQLDAASLKKNLHANKKKLAEKTAANDLLQKSVNKYKSENAELQQKVKELEARLAELEPAEQVEEAEEAAA
jgi:chromosome segregation ATPase